MLYMIFQSGWDPVLIQRIVIGCGAILENIFKIKHDNIHVKYVDLNDIQKSPYLFNPKLHQYVIYILRLNYRDALLILFCLIDLGKNIPKSSENDNWIIN